MLSKPEVLGLVTHWLSSADRPRQIVTLNALMLMGAFHDPRLNRIIQGADLITVDGRGILKALRKIGHQSVEQFTGIDLTRELLSRCARHHFPVFFYGGSPAVTAGLHRRILLEWPELHVAGIRDGSGHSDKAPEVMGELLQKQPSLLLVALGSPAQEIFLAQLLPQCKATVGIGVGGAFDVLAGFRREAPPLIRNYGWEWLYRMIQDPAKFKRFPDLVRFWYRCLR